MMIISIMNTKTYNQMLYSHRRSIVMDTVVFVDNCDGATVFDTVLSRSPF